MIENVDNRITFVIVERKITALKKILGPRLKFNLNHRRFVRKIHINEIHKYYDINAMTGFPCPKPPCRNKILLPETVRVLPKSLSLLVVCKFCQMGQEWGIQKFFKLTRIRHQRYPAKQIQLTLNSSAKNTFLIAFKICFKKKKCIFVF